MNILKKWRKQPEPGNEPNTLVKHRPTGGDGGGLARFRDFREQIDRTFDRVWREFDRDPWSALSTLPNQLGGLSNWPAVDMAEDDNTVTLRVDVPGLDQKELDVEVSGNLLTIRGQRQDEWTDKQGGVRRRERVSGSFARTITLPSYADGEKVEASYNKGTLTINIPKVPGQGPKRVRVTAN